jgi:hypothetical protein
MSKALNFEGFTYHANKTATNSRGETVIFRVCAHKRKTGCRATIKEVHMYFIVFCIILIIHSGEEIFIKAQKAQHTCGASSCSNYHQDRRTEVLEVYWQTIDDLAQDIKLRPYQVRESAELKARQKGNEYVNYIY